MNENENIDYELSEWQNGIVLTPAMANLETGIVEPAVFEGNTPVTAARLEKMSKGIKDLNKNKLGRAIIELIAVSDTAPITFVIGDKYYNKITNNIYTAISENVWSETGTVPVKTHLYVDLKNSKLYYYDGEVFNTYGGGNGITISDQPPEEPEHDDLWIDENDENTFTELDAEMSSTSSNPVQNKVIKEYVENEIGKLKRYVLFENATGQTGDLTLNDDIENYDLYEIIPYSHERMSVKQKVGMSANIISYVGDGTMLYLNTGLISVVNKTLTKSQLHGYYGVVANPFQNHSTADWYPIYQVLGYKRGEGNG